MKYMLMFWVDESAESKDLPDGLSKAGVLVRRHDDQPDRRERPRDVTTMMMYDMTTQYHAERIKTAAEQRRADERLGMMAAEVASVWRRVSRPAQALRGSWARRVRITASAR